MRVGADELRGWAAGTLAAVGVPEQDARLVAECLVEADLEGQGSHGVMRLPLYVRRVRRGLIEARPSMRISAPRRGAVLLDAGNALGPVAAAAAMDLAVERARTQGVCVCALRRGNHVGAVSFTVKRAAAAGMIGLGFSNTPPAMAPPGGTTPFLGTNPIAAAFPTEGLPVVIDMATSQVARGKLMQAAAESEPIPAGWALDEHGLPVTDAAAALRGSLAPLGGAKGFALALIVEALTGVLAGAAVGPEVGGTFADSDRPSNVGCCFIAIDAGAFGGGFAARMQALADAIRAVEPVAAGAAVRVPGDRRARARAMREIDGVDLSDSLVTELNALAAELEMRGVG